MAYQAQRKNSRDRDAEFKSMRNGRGKIDRTEFNKYGPCRCVGLTRVDFQ